MHNPIKLNQIGVSEFGVGRNVDAIALDLYPVFIEEALGLHADCFRYDTSPPYLATWSGRGRQRGTATSL